MPTITDWLMVAITIVYVVATIIICYAKIKSSNATKEQVAEAKRQYEEEHRAYITYEFFFSRRTYYGLRFTNQGKRLATNVQILLKQEFVDCISSEFFDGINELKNKEFTLGIGQSYDIYLGASDFRNNQNKKCFSTFNL